MLILLNLAKYLYMMLDIRTVHFSTYRDIHHKINKEPKFFMFRVPVDTEEVRTPCNYDLIKYLNSLKNFIQIGLN